MKAPDSRSRQADNDDVNVSWTEFFERGGKGREDPTLHALFELELTLNDQNRLFGFGVEDEDGVRGPSFGAEDLYPNFLAQACGVVVEPAQDRVGVVFAEVFPEFVVDLPGFVSRSSLE